MKIVNLDQFRAVNRVQLEGIEYEVYGLTVTDYLHKGYMEKIDQAPDRVAQITAILDVLKNLTNIPEEVLHRQPFHVLTALIMVIQGIEPTMDKLFPTAGDAEAPADETKK